ncbi:MAG: glycosyltransferase N-terminal domain-containing protein [Ginsengibacter sp.]
MLLYRIFLLLYKGGISLASLWNYKARLWIIGRKNVFPILKTARHECSGKKVIWMHCASLGEFEQGRPLLKKIKEQSPEVEFFISFFSPSGYEKIKNDGDYKYVFYLPMDSAANAKKWVEILKPHIVFWIKYEYWYFYLQQIKKNNIPLIMVSAIYKPSQTFFKWYGNFYKEMLYSFTHFFVQNADSKLVLQTIIPENKISIAGDTRCDRVINIATNFVEVPGLSEFCDGQKVVVIGSSWEDDEAEWAHFVRTQKNIKFVIAPHEIDEANIRDVKKRFPGSILYSDWLIQLKKLHEPGESYNCLVINNIGILSRLYFYADITYVGGGFGKNGLHNILEAAVFGKPVIFGPEYEKNFEASALINNSGAISIENALDLEKVLHSLLDHPLEMISRGEASKKYVYDNSGATEKIMAYLLNGNYI